MNNRLFTLAVLLLAAAPVSPSLAARPDVTFAKLHASEPPIPDGMGRIYFYRENGLMGAAVQPSIKIDGVETGGDSAPGDYFYIDKPAGSYTVSASTEKDESAQVDVVAGKAVYVKTEVSMGFFVGHVSPSVVDEATALQTINDCDLEKFEQATALAPTPATAPASAATPASPPTATSAPAPATDQKN
jgi:uncharacterized protein DUF2846